LAGENFFQGLLAVLEDGTHHALKDYRLDQLPDHTEADFVFHFIANDGTLASVDNFGFEGVSVMPGLEWALLLGVGEIFVEYELRDQRGPAFVDGHVGNRTELESDFGARSGHRFESNRTRAFGQSRWHQVELDEFRALGRRHDEIG